MDPFCHTLVGAAFGKAGLARRSPLGMGTLLIAANLPDADIAVLATNTMAVSFRRGWTHGVLAQALLPPLLASVMVAFDRLVRRRDGAQHARFGTLLLLAYVGVLSHVFLDYLNTYGVRLLMPFSSEWFYGDALYIIDPWILLILGTGAWMSWRRERHRHPHPGLPAGIGLLLATCYAGLMVGSTLSARDEVRQGLIRAGQPADTRFMVSPVPINPLVREVVIDLGDRYEKGIVSFTPWPRFRPASFGIETDLADPEVQSALATPQAHAYRAWARFPFARIDPSRSPPRVWLNDYRYSNTGPGGWSALDIDPSEH